jgi:hypothetical protein
VTFDLSSVVDPLIATIENTTPIISPDSIGQLLSSAFEATVGLFGVVV